MPGPLRASASWALAWTGSLAAHGLLLLALALAAGSDAVVPPPPLLIWVEPAPLPALPRGGAGAVTEPVAAAARPVTEGPEAQARPPDRIAPRSESRQPPAVPRRPRAARVEPPRAGPAPPAGEGVPGGAANGTPAGVRQGAPGGIAGGRAGGLGNAPLALRDVASPPELIDRVLPDYPRPARAQEIEGQVLLEVILDRTGLVEDDVRVARSIPLLDDAAVAAVKRWRFRPARDAAGRPVRVRLVIPVRFVLR